MNNANHDKEMSKDVGIAVQPKNQVKNHIIESEDSI